MAVGLSLCTLFISLFSLGFTNISSAVFTIQNSCSYTIWPGAFSTSSAIIGGGGFELSPGSTIQLPSPPDWSGRIWPRTGCHFDSAGNGHCSTGDCGGKLRCTNGGGAPPVTLVEFTLGNGAGSNDFYDVSLVDGYNVGLGVRATGGSGDCGYAGCGSDLNRNCPSELQVRDGAGGEVVACKSACLAFNSPEYCCTGDYSTATTCPPTKYSQVFKSACPAAYSYAYDDRTSLRTCSGADYVITFCPTT